jgi:hypothetical protein
MKLSFPEGTTFYVKVFGAPPPPFGYGRLSKKEREINDWLLKHGFNPLPVSNFDVGESPSEVAPRLKGSSAGDETYGAKDETIGSVRPTQGETTTTPRSPVRPREAKLSKQSVRRKVKQRRHPRSSKR